MEEDHTGDRDGPQPINIGPVAVLRCAAAGLHRCIIGQFDRHAVLTIARCSTSSRIVNATACELIIGR